MTWLIKLSGWAAIVVASAGFWFSYVFQAIHVGLTWSYLQPIIYAPFLFVGLILIAVSLSGKGKRLALIAAVILAVNALAFLLTPFTPSPM